MSVGSRIKELRENKQISRSDLAELLGVTVGAISNYENEVSSPKEPILFKIMECLNCDANYLFQDALKMPGMENTVSIDEYKLVEKYRFIVQNSPDGAKVVDTVVEREYAIAKQLTELRSLPAAIIEFPQRNDPAARITEYFRSASAGGGVFILGNEATSKIAVSASDWNECVDYVIGVSGDSMEPDYADGDKVMVSQRVELHHGDVGIFVVDGKTYIKEYGESELISRNQKCPNIRISEYSNIVCMGKVIGKLTGPFEIIDH